MQSRTVFVVFLVCLLVLVGFPARAAQRGATQSEIELRGDEVLLDLVVTDKKGNPVLDLRRDEIEVLEDGQKQDATSFGLVRIGGKSGSGPDAPVSSDTGVPQMLAKSPFRGVNLILILIDRSSVQQENLVQVSKAAEKFINERLAVNDLVAVFITANRLYMVQNFTNSKPRLLEAVKQATAGTSVLLAEPTTDSKRVTLVNAQADLQGPQSTTDFSRETNQNSDADTQLTRTLEYNAAGIDIEFANLRDQIQALSLIQSILALTKVYANVPGRKSVVLYSEGFVVTADTEGAFKSMISAANRGNFTINTVSAEGLEVVIRQDNRRTRNRQAFEESDSRMLVEGGESGLDRLVKSNLTNNDQALARLASDTGGVLVRNTNDLGKGFDAIENDLRSYYAISYAPTHTELDGSYRKIEVRVARKDVEVRSRKGYFAVPGGADSLLLPYEQPVLTLLNSTRPETRPTDLQVSMRTERFPSHDGWIVPIVLSVTSAPLAGQDAKIKDQQLIDFEVDSVALVRDSSGTVVSKLSRPAIYRIDKSRVDQFKTQTLALPQFSQQLVLAPGAYKIQIGVYDPVSKKASVIERSITLPPLAAAGLPTVSSVVLSRYAEAVAPAEAKLVARDPFVIDGKMRVVPNPSGQFVKSRGDKMVVYFQVQGKPNTQYQVLMQFLLGDQVIVGTPATAMPVTDPNGKVVMAPTIPLDAFQPGSYRAVVYILAPGEQKPIATAMTTFRVDS